MTEGKVRIVYWRPAQYQETHGYTYADSEREALEKIKSLKNDGFHAEIDDDGQTVLHDHGDPNR